jgi:hypothetical protein
VHEPQLRAAAHRQSVCLWGCSPSGAVKNPSAGTSKSSSPKSSGAAGGRGSSLRRGALARSTCTWPLVGAGGCWRTGSTAGAFGRSTCTCRSMFTSASTRSEGPLWRRPMRGTSQRSFPPSLRSAPTVTFVRLRLMCHRYIGWEKARGRFGFTWPCYRHPGRRPCTSRQLCRKYKRTHYSGSFQSHIAACRQLLDLSVG